MLNHLHQVSQLHLELDLFVRCNVCRETEVFKDQEIYRCFEGTYGVRYTYFPPIISARMQPTDHMSIGL